MLLFNIQLNRVINFTDFIAFVLRKFFHKITNWELWPFYLVYSPLVFIWAYFTIRTGRFWYFSTVNPSLEFSGFEGETKKEMFDQLSKDVYPKTIYIQPQQPFEEVVQQVKNNGFEYPIAVKPDIGTKGLCFRKIENEIQLKKYHETLPVDYLIQDMIEWPLELSLFYVRYPNQQKGAITGLIAKEYMQVMGDGNSNLLSLIQAHPKAQHFEEELKLKHANNLNTIIPAGEKYYLSITGNHNRGARFINLKEEIDEQLLQVFDGISNHSKNFYYGRYDLKTTSLADLKQGKNISILEFNGVGAEPNHIYDCGMGYWQALKTIATHWNHMYRIGKLNHQKGVPYYGFIQGFKHLRKALNRYKELAVYDVEC